jgi:ribosomal protein L11 methylase PrmA
VSVSFICALFLASSSRIVVVKVKKNEPKQSIMESAVRGVYYPTRKEEREEEEALPECFGIGSEPNHRHRVSVQALQDMLLHRDLKILIDVGAGKGHYSFMAASAGATVYSFSVHGNAMYEKSPTNKRMDWKLNDINSKWVPFVDLMIIQEWHPYEYQHIIKHCLDNISIRIIIVINHSAQCTDAMIQYLQRRKYKCRKEQTTYHICNK